MGSFNKINIPLNRALKDVNLNKADNLGLLFNKYINNWDKNFSEYKSEDIKDYLLKLEKYTEQKNYKKFIKRWQNTIISLKKVRLCIGKNASRLLIGLGNASIFENSINLHSVFGVPYIPGSSIKGSFRNFYIYESLLPLVEDEKFKKADYLDELIDSEKDKFDVSIDKFINEAIKNKLYEARAIFGSQDNEGDIVFYDAFPETFPRLRVDIMTPHYQRYYSNKETVPGDWENPTPIKFLSIDKDNSFIFVIALRNKKKIDENLLESVFSLFKKFLSDFGLGAKTSVGYGFFKDIDDSFIEKLKDRKEQELQKQKEEEAKKKEEEILSKLSEDDRIIYKIKNRKLSNEELYYIINKLEQYNKKYEIAKEIKEILISSKRWHKQKKKKLARVKKVKAVLGEE